MAGWSHRTGKQSPPLPLRATMVREGLASVGVGEAAATMSHLGHWKTKPQECRNGGAVRVSLSSCQRQSMRGRCSYSFWNNLLCLFLGCRPEFKTQFYYCSGPASSSVRQGA